jgi:predicted  nucleic acid-binding Zn-ribbon protein
MRLELADAARRVRRELDSTVVEFSYVRRAAQQAAADSFNHVAENIDTIAAKLLAGIAEVAAQAARPLDEASRRSAESIANASNTMVEALNATARQLAVEMERLGKSVVDISATINEMTTKLEKMRTPDGVIEVRLDPVIASLTDAVDRFSAQSDRQVATIRELVEAAKGAVQGSSASMAALRDDVEVSSTASRAALKAAHDSSDAVTQVLDQFNADAWEQVELLRGVLERTDGAFRVFTETVAKSSAGMASQNQGLHDMLATIQTSAETLAAATDRLADIAGDIGARRVAQKREAIS